ncbi:hypothetical protein IV505_11250 [Pseudomonas fulva]|nr:hypothetical protein [Pseudomonas fulva]MBF8780298.1 hypothetical protein [Pseudomonas fulva]
MRRIPVLVASCLFVSLGAQAKPLSQQDKRVCDWGAGIAAQAQQAKLSGVSLYTARKRLQNQKFPKSWMRMTAFGITEQTYNSQSRLAPTAIRQTYQEQCAQHAISRR